MWLKVRLRTSPQAKSSPGPSATEVAVQNGQGKVYLLTDQTVLRSCDIGLSNQPVGRKQFERDGTKPHGLCLLDRFTPRSRDHPSAGVSYRNQRDKAYAAESWRGAGGGIMAHSGGLEGGFFPRETALELPDTLH